MAFVKSISAALVLLTLSSMPMPLSALEVGMRRGAPLPLSALDAGMRRDTHQIKHGHESLQEEHLPPISLMFKESNTLTFRDPGDVCSRFSEAGCVADKPNQARGYYSDYVPEESQEKMTHEVCWNFCRTVSGSWGFGLEMGSKCFCSPYVDAGDSPGSCSTACPGNSTQMCGGASSATVFRMHDCDPGAIKCKMSPPSVANAIEVESSAYGESTPCQNYGSVFGDTRQNANCEIKCVPGFESLHNSIECSGKTNRHGNRWALFTGWAACNPKSCGLPPCVNHARYPTSEVLFPDTVQYTCQLGYALGGVADGAVSFQVNCSTDGNFTSTSECLPIKCGDAPQDPFANLTSSGGPQLFGMVSKYTCIEGYTLSTQAGGDKTYTRICEPNGNFSDGLRCKAVSCGPPPSYKNASLKESRPDAVTYMEKLSYGCNPGFSIDARPAEATLKNDVFTSSCTKEGFFTVAFSPCIRVSCGLPVPVDHAKMIPHEAFVFFKDNVSYTCDLGYTTDGNADGVSEFTLSCGDNGKFTSEPKVCKPVTCGEAPVFPNAKVVSGSGARHYPDSVPYKCNPGYSIRPKDDPTNMTSATFSIGCLDTGKFTTAPVCINVNNCKQPFVKHCSFHGACVDHAAPTGDPDKDWHCVCDSGYESISFTKDTGARNENCSNIDDCPPSGAYAHGCGGSGIGECKDELNKYRCACEYGYVEIEVKTSPNTTCIPMSCKALPTVSHAKYYIPEKNSEILKDLLENTKVDYNATELLYKSSPVTYKCHEGYTLTGVAGATHKFDVVCEKFGSGVGLSLIVDCKPVTCGAPPMVSNSHIVDPPDIVEMFYTQVVKYVCDQGYTNDEQGKYVADAAFKIKCQSSGSATAPQKCVPVQCGKPPVLERAKTAEKSYFFMENLEYTCEKGYSIDASNNAEAHDFSSSCQFDGTFLTEDNLTKCVPIKCGEPPEVEHAETDKSGMTLVYGDSAKYHTLKGYTMDGKASGQTTFKIDCESNSNFVEKMGQLPVMPVECGVPPSVGNASLQNPAPRVFKEKVNYTCNFGFSTDGLPALHANEGLSTVCEATGKFAPITEHCKPVVCDIGKLPKEELTNATLEGSAPFTFVHPADFQCKTGYSLSGLLNGTVDFSLPCKADGSFAPSPPKCLNINDCEGSICAEDGHGKCFDKPVPVGAHFDNYECHCDSGFLPDVLKRDGVKLHYCKNINDCPPSACLPGVCEDLINGYKCHAPPGHFAGPKDFVYDPNPSDEQPLLTRGQEPKNESVHKQYCLPPLGSNYLANDVATLIYFQDVVTYKCLDGYSLNGKFGGPVKFDVKCRAGPANGKMGNLTTITKLCRPVSCGVPPRKDKAKRSTLLKVLYGQSVEYTCKPGYSTNTECGESFKAFSMACGTDGKLSFVDADKNSCKAVNAGKPSVPFGVHKTDDMFYPDRVQVKCEEGYSVGYKPSGAFRKKFKLKALANCTIGANIPRPYACIINKCGVPADVKEMTANVSEVVHYKQGVLYTANPGYTVDGTANGQKTISMSCQADATFTSIDDLLPLKPVSCGRPGPTKHATVPAGKLTYLQNATYTCAKGYSLDGKPSDEGTSNHEFLVVCVANGSLVPSLGLALKSSCIPVECGKPPALPNALATSPNQGVVFPEVAPYKCNPGYSLDGSLGGPIDFSPPCMASGQFKTDSFECQNMDDCEGNKCGAHGACVDKSHPTGKHIDDYWCDCQSGFENKTIEENGKTYQICGNIPDCPPDACKPGSCQDLINDYACICPDGYYAGENKEKGLKSDCLPLSCGVPPTHVNATFSGGDGERVFLNTVKYKCKEGYTLDGSPLGISTFEIKCGLSPSQDGTVSFTKLAQCQLIICGKTASQPTANKNSSHLLFGETVGYKCHEGFSTSGNCEDPSASKFSMTCKSDGSIVNADGSSEEKTCVPVLAGTPTETQLPYSYFGKTQMYYGDYQTVICKLGFSTDPYQPSKSHFVLETTSTCSFKGHPVCQNVSCGSPPAAPHATVPNDKIVFPNKAVYTAETGYTLDGKASGPKSFNITCTADTSFEGMEQLQPVFCGSPKDLANAICADDELTFGQSAEYTCLEGFSLDGLVAGAKNMKFSVTCQATGDFSAANASCKPVVCGHVPFQPNAKVVENKSFVAFESASFECLPGWALDGGATDFTVECEASGKFQTPVICKNIDDCEGETCGGHGTCEDLPNPIGDHIKDYICKCDSGYEEKVGNVTRVCENINDCPTDACQPGLCEDLINTYVCNCPTGYHNNSVGIVNSSCKVQTCNAPVVQHGSAAPADPSTPILSTGPRLYRCDSGYSLDGAYSEAPLFNITCEGNDVNTPHGKITQVPSCIPVNCGDVAPIDHASPSTTQLHYPQEVTYDCNAGYSTLGTCGIASKGFFKAKCAANGSIVYVDAQHTSCEANFAGIPTAEMLPNAEFALNQRMTYGMNMTVTCLPGYSTNMFYVQDLQHEVKQICLGATLQAFTGKTVTVTIASTSWEEPDYKMDITIGGKIMFTPSGAEPVTANHDGFDDWVEYFKILPGAADALCKEIGRSFKITYTFGPDLVLKKAEEVGLCKFEAEVELPMSKCLEVESKKETILTLKSEFTRKANSFLLVPTYNCGFRERPMCMPVSCGAPPEIPYASTKNNSDIFFGSSVTYNCPEGYTLSGKAGGQVSFQIKCLSNGMFSAFKKCQPVRCGAAISLPLASILSGLKHGTKGSSTPNVTRGAVLTYKDQVVYDCLDGYSVKPDSAEKSAPFTASCEKNGHFLGMKKCLPKVCPLANRTHSSVLTESAVYLDKVMFRCEYGFSVTGTPPKSARDLEYIEGCLSNASVSRTKHCKDINFCLTEQYCGKGGECIDGLSNYSCNCFKGYKVAPINISQRPICVEVDECDDWDGHSHCSPNGKCVDGFAKFTCDCHVGYLAKNVPGEPNKQKCRGVVCGPPPEIEYATRQSNLDKVIYPVKVPYQCDDGYSLTGTLEGDTKFRMACQADRTFVGLTESSNYSEEIDMPACIPLACPPDLPVVENSIVEGGPLYFDSPEAIYTCEPGYSTSGAPQGPTNFTVACNNKGQFTEPAKCLPVSCGAPPNVEHASFDSDEKVFKEKTKYTCEEGYTMDGNADGCPTFSVTCQASGNFTKVGACTPVSCLFPPFFEHANYEPDVKVFNEVFQVMCHSGYKAADGGTTFNVRCLKTGLYGTSLSCLPVSCGKPTKTAHAIPTTPSVEVFYTESTVWECHDGYSVNGLKEGEKLFTRTCDANGKFLEATPSDCKDIDFCYTKPCGVHGKCFDCTSQPDKCKGGMSPSKQGTFLQTDSSDIFKSNGQYACLCSKGYEVTEADGTLKCTEDDCHGRSCGPGGSCMDLSVQGIEDAYSCTCEEGYYLTGSDEEPTCAMVICSNEPPVYPHAEGRHIYGRLSTGDSVVRAFDSIEYGCFKGYSTDGSIAKEAASFSVECSPVGLFRNVNTCKRIKCESSQLPNVPNANMSKSQKEEFYEYGDKVEFTCAAGYYLAGESKSNTVGADRGTEINAFPWTIASNTFTVECQANGEFTKARRCTPRSCGTPPPIANAYSSLAVVHYPEVVNYHCDDGYFTNMKASKFVVQCGADGNYTSKDLESCYPVQCSDSFFYPESRRVECPIHMTLNGHTDGLTFFEETCTRDGTIWRGGASCQPITYSVAGVVSDAADGMLRLQGALVEFTKAPVSSMSCAELGWKDKTAKIRKTPPRRRGSTRGLVRPRRRMSGKNYQKKSRWMGVAGICGQNKSNCSLGQTNKSTADAYCTSLGARLCTHLEMFRGETCGSGCGLNAKPVWTSTPCPGGDGFLTVRCKDRSVQCLSDDSGYAGRCCANANTDLDSSSKTYSVTAGRSGEYLAKLSAGEYLLKASAGGYIADTRELLVQSDIHADPGPADMALSPVMPPSEWRVVLSWDYKSRDLDSWLSFGTGTMCNEEGCSGACETGWSWPHEECSRDSMNVEATLERDFTRGIGPETIMIKGIGDCVKSPIQDCIIVYMVWNYTPDSAPLGLSGARVAVFAGGKKVATLEVPVEASDKVWYPVLTIDASNGKWYPGDHTEALIAANPYGSYHRW